MPALYIPKKTVGIKKVPDVSPGARWYVFFRYDGKLYKKKKGLNRFETIDQRKRVGLEMVGAFTDALRRGWSPVDNTFTNQVQDDFLSIENAVIKALKMKKNEIAVSTYSQYREGSNRFIVWLKLKMLAGIPVSDFTRRMFSEYLKYLAAEDNNPTSVNNNKRVMSSLFSKLVQDFVIEVNPAANIQTKKSAPIKNRPFTAKQFEQIVKKTKELDPYLLNFYAFMIYALLRPREIIRLKKGDVVEDVIYLRTKTHDATISIIGSLKPLVSKLVKAAETNEDNLITNQEKPYQWDILEKSRTNHFIRKFQVIKKACDLDDNYGLYSIRHMAIFTAYQYDLKKGYSHNEIISRLLAITRHKSEKELSAYLRDVGALLPPDYSDRFDFNL